MIQRFPMLLRRTFEVHGLTDQQLEGHVLASRCQRRGPWW